VRRGAVGKQKEGQVLVPLLTLVLAIGGSRHTLKSVVETLDEADGVVVMSCNLLQSDATVFIDGLAQLGDEVGTWVGADGAGEAIAGEDVMDEEIEDLLGGRIGGDGDGFDPAREAVGKHH
jgi:hypothetical protein